MAKAKRRRAGRVSTAAQQGSKRKQKNFLLYGMTAVAGVAVIAAIVVGITLGSGGGGTGDQAPDFNFSLYQGFGEIGERHSDLSRLHGKPIVLNFWAGLCPPCRAEMPQFQVFYEEFKDQVTLLGIDVGPFTGLGSHQDADELLQELGVTYPAGWTDDGSVTRKYGVTSMPTTVFIDSSGKIFDKRAGAIDRNALVRSTTRLLAAEAEDAS